MPVITGSIIGSELPQTVGDLIAATRDHLLGMYRSMWNQLAADVAVGDTVLTFTGPVDGAVRGSLISIDDEIMYVQDNPQTNQVTVIRGFDTTAAATHTAGTLVEVAPRFPKHVIRRQLAMEIGSWPDNLFQVAHTSFTLVNDGRTFSYDLGLTSDQVVYLLDVRHAPWMTGRDRNNWPRFVKPPYLNRSVDVATFPSGMCLTIVDDWIPQVAECTVTYASPFNLLSMDDTVIVGPGGLGLGSSMLDIPPLGAAARLIGPRDALRTMTEARQSERNTQDVQPGAAIRVGMYLKTLRDQRIKEEAEHLNTAWPVRTK